MSAPKPPSVRAALESAEAVSTARVAVRTVIGRAIERGDDAWPELDEIADEVRTDLAELLDHPNDPRALVDDVVVLYAIRYCIGRSSIGALTDGPALVVEHAGMLRARGWAHSVACDIEDQQRSVLPGSSHDARGYWARALVALRSLRDDS